ncbi:translation initiation factor eIF-2B epsilon subunit, GEF [Hypoxylon texense]
MASDRVNSATHGFTLTALSRWSILDKKLPPVEKIKAIHVYDFDNTLFKTPLPNQKLWNNTTVGQLSSPHIFINGGWWHDPKILAATGEGAEQEEKRAWDGWWNEKVVELVHLTMKQDDALCVLLTGRSEQDFSPLIKRIVKSKGLDFDMVGLKPAVGPNNERFRDTMGFKQVFIRSLLATYTHVDEIRIYEDRVRHVAGFRDFLDEYNKQRVHLGLGPLTAEVIPVAEISTSLDPVVEVAEVQHLINIHNALIKEQPGNRKDHLAIKKTVFFTSYMIEPADTARLIALFNSIVPEMDDLKYLANTILITAKPCPKSILDKIGGMNSKMKWEVADIGSVQKNLWAIRVKPVPANAQFHTDNPFPSVVVGLRRGARPADVNKIYQWQAIPPEKSFVFETTVGEKVMLRIEHEHQQQDGNQYTDDQSSERLSQPRKRKYPADEDRRSRHGGNFGGNNNNHNNSNNNNREFHSSSFQGRGGGGGGGGENRGRGAYRGNGPSRGNRGGGRGGFRGSNRGGRGGAHGYRSLDDVDTRENGHGGFSASTVSYDDSFPSMPQGGSQQQQQQQQQQQPLPPPPQYGQPFPQQGGQWPAPNGAPSQTRPVGAPGPDLQNFY